MKCTSLALYSATQLRELDRLAIQEQRIPGYILMTRAAQASLDLLRAQWPQARRLAVYCGTGNNGGDGYVLARLALQAGLEAWVIQLGESERIAGDARHAREDYLDVGGRVACFPAGIEEAVDLRVDALLGTGLQRAVEGLWLQAITLLDTRTGPVLALDIPSGLHADTGMPLGCAVRASRTISFIGLKPGLFTGEGTDYCGQIACDDLDVPAEVYEASAPTAHLLAPYPQAVPLARRSRTAHKGQLGHVLLVGGDHGMGGAVRMAAEAAARSGAGRVSVATRAVHVGPIIAARPELMCREIASPGDLGDLMAAATVIAIGPGLGQAPWGRSLLETVLDSPGPLIVDADALNLLAEGPRCRQDWVLTPHPGEAARLLGCTTAQIQADRFAAAHALQQRYGGVCVLKGAGTLIASSGGITVCAQGNPGMAGGGMGDVLTGVIAGLAAQGLRLEQAAQAGVQIHALAGDQAASSGERGLLAGDLFPFIHRLVNPQP